MPSLILRPLTGRAELPLFNRLPYDLNGELAEDLDAGRRRPELMWVALRGDRLIARLAWWSDGPAPNLLDVFDVADDVDRLDVGVRLLRTAMERVLPEGSIPPNHIRYAPPDWRTGQASGRVTRDVLTTLERTGARLFVERLRLEWRPGTPLPERDGRLRFRPLRDTEELLDLMTRVLEGTLDAHSTQNLTRMSPREAATAHFEGELARYTSPRSWWRVATLPDGEPVGFVTPGHNHYNAVIGYLAVLPEHRGRGHIHGILAEGTRFLAGQGVPLIRAATDLGNTPMAAAFQRAGYATLAHVLNSTWE
ncbi:GNAT family N-acetyltransferase [Nocardiopsis sp. NPDC055551]